MELAYWQWALAMSGGFLIGLSKSGLKGIAVFMVTLMALAFGSKASTGIVLVLLMVGDIFAVIYYTRYTKWKYLKAMVPWMIFGVLIGVAVGQDLPEKLFKNIMAVVILITLAMMIWWEKGKEMKIPTHWSFAAGMGTLAGITTMIGNLAGAFSNIYFLAMRLPKNEFIGTAAWLFFIINIFKFPFHVFVWKTITMETLMVNLKLLPSVIAGLLIGVFLVKKINEKFFRRMILVLTAIGALMIFFR